MIQAITIIGCKVSEDMLDRSTSERKCYKKRIDTENNVYREESDLTDCSLEDNIDYKQYGDDFQVCPFCIRSPYEINSRNIHDEKGEFQVEGYPHRLSVVRSNTECFVGLVASKADEGSSYTIHDISNIALHRNQLKAALEPLGLWREISFGVHSVLVVSDD